MKNDIIFNLSKNKLGFGGQGMVYQIKIPGYEDKYVDKMSYPLSDRKYAHQKINGAYDEFLIAKELSHPNIVSYKWFAHIYSDSKKVYQSHTILEMLEGGDMVNYLKKYNKTADKLENARLFGA
jgi:serine/threonine protein kinase